MRITVVAFTDEQKNSVDYRNFVTIEKAVEFYEKMLRLEYVNTISTRKVRERC